MFNPLELSLIWETPRQAEAPRDWLAHAPFAMGVVELLRPRLLVELGTGNGNSYLAFCQAIRHLKLPAQARGLGIWDREGNQGGSEAEIPGGLRAAHDASYGDFSRLAPYTGETREQFEDRTIDLLHIDGSRAGGIDHTPWLSKISPGGVILVYGTASDGRELWERVKEGRSHFEFPHSGGLGLAAAGELRNASLASLLAAQQRVEGERARRFFARLGASIRTDSSIDPMENEREEFIRALKSQVEALGAESNGRPGAFNLGPWAPWAEEARALMKKVARHSHHPQEALRRISQLSRRRLGVSFSPRPRLDLSAREHRAFERLIAKLGLAQTPEQILPRLGRHLAPEKRERFRELLDFISDQSDEAPPAAVRRASELEPVALSSRAKEKMLIIAGEFPNPIHGGGGRLADFIEELSRHYEIYLLAWYVPQDDHRAYQQIRRHCRRIVVLPPEEFEQADPGPLDELVAGVEIDLVHYAWPRALKYYRPQLAPRHIFTYVEAVSLRLLMDLARESPFGENWWEILVKLLDTLRTELLDATPMDAKIVVTKKDGEFLARFDPAGKYFVVPTPVKFRDFCLPEAEPHPRAIVFVGHFLHYPNEDAMRFFFGQIFPRLRVAVPDVRCYIVGAHPTREVLAYNDNERVFVTGTVDDIRPYIQRATVCLAPLVNGAGIRGKVNQYAALRRPCVGTTIAAEDLAYEDGREMYITDDPALFADRIAYLLSSPEEARRMGEAAFRTAQAHYDSPQVVDGLRRIHAYLGAHLGAHPGAQHGAHLGL